MMSASLVSLDLYVRGVTCGALLILGVGIGCSRRLSRRARVAMPLTFASALCWLITVSPPTWSLFGDFEPLLWASFPAAGLFWLMIRIVFDDSPPRRLDWAPAACLLIVRMPSYGGQTPLERTVWFVGNVSAILLVCHAAYLVVQGHWDDLLERRRWLRVIVFGSITLFALSEGVLGTLGDRARISSMYFVDQPFGVLIFSTLLLATMPFLLEARLDLFGPPSRRGVGEADAVLVAETRAKAADRVLLDKLQAAMEDGVWRRDGLTIGALARQLEVSEHQLRRLINNRLGFRNFAEFLNSRRIEQAKQRLVDPACAKMNVATIAFDLGYGSLGPFNRAFRTATGTTPTAWRSSALKASPNL